MKILLRKASDYREEEVKVIEIENIMELKNIYSSFILNFDKEEYRIEKYGNYDFEAMIYDDYVE